MQREALHKAANLPHNSLDLFGVRLLVSDPLTQWPSLRMIASGVTNIKGPLNYLIEGHLKIARLRAIKEHAINFNHIRVLHRVHNRMD